MNQQLLRRAWDALDSFKQAYPENWQEEDQQVLEDLMKANLDLSGVKRKENVLSDERIKGIFSHYGQYATGKELALVRTLEVLLEGNT